MASKADAHRIDRGLGEHRRIARRDFLQGCLSASATMLCGPLLCAPAPQLPYSYPPRLTGMRGTAPGSFESAHALRDGTAVPVGIDTGEVFDLIVVGAGISGLACAQFFRNGTSARASVLLLDNNDDFGGHARRNEFKRGGATELINGGTYSIESPRPYSAVSEALIRDLGIDVDRLARKIENRGFYGKLGMRGSVFFDKETFAADKLVVGEAAHADVVAAYPISSKARADILRIETGTIDFMPGLSSAEKKQRLSRMSYGAFLRDLVGAHSDALNYYQCKTHGWWGVGIDAVSALDCWGIDLPGFRGLKLAPGSIARMGYTPAGFADTGGSKTLHFPDGNATIARLLVRRLIPDAIPGNSVQDIVSAEVAYGALDRLQSPVRLRLNSTALKVINTQSSQGGGVEVTYLRDGNAYCVRARNCVLACYNMMIPYLCPDLPAAQKEALHSLVKTPLVYTSVALRHWEAFNTAGTHHIYSPGSYYSEVELNWHVNIGSYRSPTTASQPILIHMLRTPCQPGFTEIEQNRAGRAELLATPFSTFERNIRDQLGRTLGHAGFDPARDVQAITVNRWPHGYAPEYNPLFEPELPEAMRANVLGRARHGRIAIANSDAGAAAYTDSAIDQAHRAVSEILDDNT